MVASPFTVLVVDDEPDVLAMTAEVLRDDDYRVIEASDPAIALDILSRVSPVDVLVTDVVMRGMSGYDLAVRAKALRSGLKVLYVSGYDSGPETHDGPRYGPLLWKPFRATQLLEAVRLLTSS